MGLKDSLNQDEWRKVNLINKYRPILAKTLGLKEEEIFPHEVEEEQEME